MTDSGNSTARPPRLADFDFFVSSDEAPPMLGDLVEEFSTVATRKGISDARRWYWRQSMKTIFHLLMAQFRSASRWNVAAVLGGVILLCLTDGASWFSFFLSEGRGLFSVITFSSNWPEPLRLLFVGTSLLAIPELGAFFSGWLIASLSRGREWVVTLTLCLLRVVMVRAFGYIPWHARPTGIQQYVAFYFF